MAVNKVVMNTENGENTLIDLTSDNVTPETLAEGTTAHDASGNVITGVGKTTSVLYTAQTLTNEQKAQARANIGAEEYPTPDWMANTDGTGYILNRTHYSEYTNGEELLERPATFTDGEAVVDLSSTFHITVGDVYGVTIDGVEYISEAVETPVGAAYGNTTMFDNYIPDEGQPVAVIVNPEDSMSLIVISFDRYTTETVMISFSHKRETVHQLPEKYIPPVKNPNALTINGTAYDGSKAVDMTTSVNAMIDAKLGVIENGSY